MSSFGTQVLYVENLSYKNLVKLDTESSSASRYPTLPTEEAWIQYKSVPSTTAPTLTVNGGPVGLDKVEKVQMVIVPSTATKYVQDPSITTAPPLAAVAPGGATSWTISRAIPPGWAADNSYYPTLTSSVGGAIPYDGVSWHIDSIYNLVVFPNGVPSGHSGQFILTFYRYTGTTGGGGGGGGFILSASTGGGTPLITVDNSPTSAVLMNLVQGTGGIGIVAANVGINTGTITINNTLSGTNIGAGVGIQSIFSTKNGANLLEFRNLKPSVTLGEGGIALGIDNDAITIGNTMVGANLLTTSAPPATANIYFGKSTNTLQFRTLKAGTNITLAEDATYVTINAAGGGGGSSPFLYSTNATTLAATGKAVSIDTTGAGGSIPGVLSFVFGADAILTGAVVKSTTEGAGVRLQFDNVRGSLRAGYTSESIVGASTWWDEANRGFTSIAMGSYTRAVGTASFAMGFNTRVGVAGTGPANYSVAFGQNNAIQDAAGSGSSWSGILSGNDHTILNSDNSVIVGGGDGTITGGNKINSNSKASFIGGGTKNMINEADLAQTNGAIYSTIGGGIGNSIVVNKGTATRCVIVGGTDNKILDSNQVTAVASECFIGGGNSNQIGFSGAAVSSIQSVIVGGKSNKISTSDGNTRYCFIGGGLNNQIQGDSGSCDYSVIVGGTANIVYKGEGSYIGGGTTNKINQALIGAAYYNTIVGGNTNSINSVSSPNATPQNSTIVGGIQNSIIGSESAVIVGGGNTTTSLGNIINRDSNNTFIGGGSENKTNASATGASAKYSTIVGGEQNQILSNGNGTAEYNVICGGKSNNIYNSADDASSNANYCFVGGGEGNIILGTTTALGNASHCVIAGGKNNTICNNPTEISTTNFCVISGGEGNGIMTAASAAGTSTHCVIAGGIENLIYEGSTKSVIGGGGDNKVFANSAYCSIGGGSNNTITDAQSVISGGQNNEILAGGSFIGGGGYNQINTTAYRSVICGGGNLAGAPGNTILAGARDSFIGGGQTNVVNAIAVNAFIGGGQSNNVYAQYGTIGGGLSNRAGVDNTKTYSTVAGGKGNNALSDGAFIGGGGNNYIDDTATLSVICGGGDLGAITNRNQINPACTYSFIGGGLTNVIAGSTHASIMGGQNNSMTATSSYSSIMGGQNNLITNSTRSCIIGSDCIISTGSNGSIAMGSRAVPKHLNSFVWGDGGLAGTTSTESTADRSFTVRAQGGFTFITTNTAPASIGPTDGVYLGPGAVTWGVPSDRNFKENLVEVDALSILNKLDNLPLYYFNYKGREASNKNIGPMAQDWQALFPLGRDRLAIDTLEFDGVALSSIKGLYQVVKAQKTEIESQKTEIEELKKKNTELEARLQAIEAKLATL